jgi:hypothetical protein
MEEWRWLPLLLLCWYIIAAAFNPIVNRPLILITAYVLAGIVGALVFWVARD